ncbi:MAG: GGDEF domain-containing protein [Planctomycetota bacterium]
MMNHASPIPVNRLRRHLPAADRRGGAGRDPSTVGYHLSRSVLTVEGHETLAQACRLMSRYRIGCLPVLEGFRLAGMVTDQLILDRVSRGMPLEVPVREAAIPAVMVDPKMSIHRAIEQVRHEHVHHLMVAGPDGRFAGLVSQTDLLEASRRLLAHAEDRAERAEAESARDALTGVFTRGYFDRALEAEFRRAGRFGGLLALVFFDLDHFKSVNDRFGHAAGDEVLRRFGRILRDRTRPGDTPARYGGEEFSALLPGRGTRAAVILAEQVCRDLRHIAFMHEGVLFRVTVSAGVCKWGGEFSAPLDMITEADRCLYEAKRSGRNRVEVAS